jgi:hypothetical protein
MKELRVAFEVSGPSDGIAVVALRGWPDSPRTWNGVHSDLHENDCRVYRPYLRGFGPTRFRDDETPRSGQIAVLCRDLREFVDSLEIDDFVLAGHNRGARRLRALRDEPSRRQAWSRCRSPTEGPGQDSRRRSSRRSSSTAPRTAQPCSRRPKAKKAASDLPTSGGAARGRHFVPREAPSETAAAILELT